MRPLYLNRVRLIRLLSPDVWWCMVIFLEFCHSVLFGRSNVFRVIRLGEGEKVISVYEGDMCSTRIKGLVENTDYRFQIRSTDR